MSLQKVTFSVQFIHSLASISIFHALIIAIEELPIEQLDCNDSKDKVEEKVDDENVEHVLEGDDHAVEDGLQLGDPVDGLQRSQDPQQLDGF